MSELFWAGIIVALLCGTVAWLVNLCLKQRKNLKKYAPIMSVEDEVKSLRAEADKIVQQQNAATDKTVRRQKELNAEIGEAEAHHARLKNEISLYEPKMDLIDVGMFEPIFDFADSDEYKQKIADVKDRQKEMIRLKTACNSPFNEVVVNDSRREGAKLMKNRVNLALRAFNGETDSIIARVRWNNVENFAARIEAARDKINAMGNVMQIKISRDYMQLKLKELHLVYGRQYKLRQEAEERRARAEALREEEKARREIENAIKDAEADEMRNHRALEKARAEYQRRMEAKDANLNKYLERVRDLEEKLKEAVENRERAKSRAQLTKAGYVYIISNIGSFGESVYKIGMTRRLHPMDRVRELGDASVPFLFDTHAIVYSEDAPRLEGELHKRFAGKRVNRVNARKEFFNVSLEEVRDAVQNFSGDVDFIAVPEAEEYRETISIIAREDRESTAAKAA